jgi:hypothetical protein
MIDEGDISSIQYKMSLNGSNSMRKVNGPSMIIDFYVPELTPHLLSSLKHNPLRDMSHTCIYRCYQQRDFDRQQMFGSYMLYNVGAGRDLVALIFVYPLA